MKQDNIKRQAEQLGYRDAKQGHVYRHSADPGSWVRNWMPYYEKGWQRGRKS